MDTQKNESWTHRTYGEGCADYLHLIFCGLSASTACSPHEKYWTHNVHGCTSINTHSFCPLLCLLISVLASSEPVPRRMNTGPTKFRDTGHRILSLSRYESPVSLLLRLFWVAHVRIFYRFYYCANNIRSASNIRVASNIQFASKDTSSIGARGATSEGW